MALYDRDLEGLGRKSPRHVVTKRLERANYAVEMEQRVSECLLLADSGRRPSWPHPDVISYFGTGTSTTTDPPEAASDSLIRLFAVTCFSLERR